MAELSKLFQDFTLKGLALKNRIMMSPMCMYSAGDDGRPTDWHLVHYGTRAVGGVGLIMQEATAVERRGRISGNDLGLWEDAQVEPLKRLVDFVHAAGAKMAVQLAHAGRKCGVPGERIVAPSSLHWNDEYPVPAELTRQEISTIVAAFGRAARRAVAAGYDAVEVHAAHGYLIHEFLSPLSNQRTDEYGGTRENRVRFLRAVLEEVRANIPAEMPLFLRVSANDFVPGGLDIGETVEIVRLVKELVDLVDVSSGGLLAPRIDLYAGYQVNYAAAVRQEVGLPTGAVGLITTPELAEEIIGNGRADLVVLGRALLRRPYWPLYAAHVLKAEIPWPREYERGKYR